MKLSTLFTILAATSLAIARVSAIDDSKNQVASLLCGEEGTRQLKKKKKKKKKKPSFTTKAFDIRLPHGAQTSLLKHGPMEVFA
jgi:hypothetical protein